jgi:predicted nucleotide-binding protein
VTNEDIIAEIKRYEATLSAILSRFTHTSDGIHIARDDDPLLRQIVHEIIDLFGDVLGPNSYSSQIAAEFNEGVSNFIGSPSYKSVENIISVIRAVITRLQRSPEILDRKRSQQVLARRDNIFIIHGRDEAKWRELKDIVASDFRLNPIVLIEQPNAGCQTVVEKFEHYAQSCSYAIAIFTPDDEVTAKEEAYLQARPNVIYELGWFCGRLGRSGAMLLLKEGTSVFSDFGGIIQRRFARNVSECAADMRRDLVAAGILDEV